MQQTNRNRLVLIAILAIATILVAFAIFYYALRAGKTSVTIAVVPHDATIKMDGKVVKPGNIYLTPGTYTFVASKDGFGDDRQIVKISGDSMLIGLTPDPASDEARAWLKNNPDAVTEREALGGMTAERQGAETRDKNPIVKLLPYYDSEGLYAINYGVEKGDEKHIFILINNSAPEGRKKAVQWMERQGYNPAELDIRFGDFENPLTGKIERGL